MTRNARVVRNCASPADAENAQAQKRPHRGARPPAGWSAVDRGSGCTAAGATGSHGGVPALDRRRLGQRGRPELSRALVPELVPALGGAESRPRPADRLVRGRGSPGKRRTGEPARACDPPFRPADHLDINSRGGGGKGPVTGLFAPTASVIHAACPGRQLRRPGLLPSGANPKGSPDFRRDRRGETHVGSRDGAQCTEAGGAPGTLTWQHNGENDSRSEVGSSACRYADSRDRRRALIRRNRLPNTPGRQGRDQESNGVLPESSLHVREPDPTHPGRVQIVEGSGADRWGTVDSCGAPMIRSMTGSDVISRQAMPSTRLSRRGQLVRPSSADG